MKVPVVQARRSSSYRRIFSIFFSEVNFFFSLTKQIFPFPVAHCSKGANQERQKRKKEKSEKKSIFEKNAHRV